MCNHISENSSSVVEFIMMNHTNTLNFEEMHFKLNVTILESDAMHSHSPDPNHDQMGRVLEWDA